MRLLLFLCVPVYVAFFTAGCSGKGKQAQVADSTFTVSLNVKGLDSGLYVLYYTTEGKRKADSIRIIQGQGVLTGKVPAAVRAYLQRAVPPGYDMLPLYLENGSINISGALDSMSNAKVTGTPTNQLNAELQKLLEPLKREEELLNKEMETAMQNKTISEDSAMAMWGKLADRRKAITIGFVAAHRDNLISVHEVTDLFIFNPDPKEFDSVVQLLDTALLKTQAGVELIKRLEIAKSTDIGQPAPQFTMNDVNGKPVALSSLYGKFLLIDFWASWCGPCRADNPNLVKTYNDYHKKGFDIVSVSLDSERDKDKWLEAISKDKLTWLQLSDLKGWDNQAARLYGINGIPMNFLLDQQGRIIAKGLRGSALREKMSGLIN
jgi:peroxiredoxin